MLTENREALIAKTDDLSLYILPKMANRHGLITGATGTGKTCTLQNMAESFSSMGIPVFATDIKGDLAGVSQAGGANPSLQKSVDRFNLVKEGFDYQPFPVCFWDIFGQKGHPLRATISEMGPLLISRLLDLNDTQSGVLSLTFKIADEENLLLLDLKDLRKMLEHVGNERARYTVTHGNISTASIGSIQRGLLMLEEQGGNFFFGEPSFDIFDLIQTRGGKGMINLLAADKLIRSPKIYTSFLLFLLSELFEQLPEVGDLDQPKLVFFFDEAHLLFNGISKVLLEKIEQVVRLIRSKGVGVYFCTQNPMDIPDTILGQMGNRVQHALRAFTPNDQKAVSAAAKTFRQNPAFDTQNVIMELGVGEALISFLDEKGRPTMVERAMVLPPEGRAGTITDDERERVMKKSMFLGVYDKEIDRESAYELLSAQMERRAMEVAEAQQQKELEKQQKETARLARQEQIDRNREERERKRAKDQSFGGSLTKMTSTRAKREVVNQMFKFGRGLLGSLMKK